MQTIDVNVTKVPRGRVVIPTKRPVFIKKHGRGSNYYKQKGNKIFSLPSQISELQIVTDGISHKLMLYGCLIDFEDGEISLANLPANFEYETAVEAREDYEIYKQIKVYSAKTTDQIFLAEVSRALQIKLRIEELKQSVKRAEKALSRMKTADITILCRSRFYKEDIERATFEFEATMMKLKQTYSLSLSIK